MNREKILALLASALARGLFFTVRLKMKDHSRLTTGLAGPPVILTFWHNRILAITLAFLRHYPNKQRKGVSVLTSPSRDGEILAQLMACFQMGSVRGSSSRRGSRALLELIGLIEEGHDIAITPDGPRGPCYTLSPGVIQLAQKTGAPIIPVQAEFSRAIRMKTWDQFMIPLPFSCISVTVGEPVFIPPELGEEAFEAERLKMENLLKHAAD